MRWWRSSGWAEVSKGLALTPEEGFVLSLLEQPLTVDEVIALSSLAGDRVTSICGLLADKGLLETDAPKRQSQHTIPDADEDDEVTIEKVSSKRPQAAGTPFDALADFSAGVPPELLAAVKAASAPPPPPMPLPPEPAPEPKKKPQMSVPTPAELRAADVIARLAARARAATGSPAEVEPAPVSQERERSEGGEAGQALSPMAMLNAYTVVINESLPDATRESAREWMRNTFTSASPESRATFLWDTEGHTLPVFAGIPFDARVTTILCAKTYASQLLVQNLAKFTACPANLLTHLLRQNLVRRNPTLKRLVLNHPNLPNEVRKRG